MPLSSPGGACTLIKTGTRTGAVQLRLGSRQRGWLREGEGRAKVRTPQGLGERLGEGEGPGEIDRDGLGDTEGDGVAVALAITVVVPALRACQPSRGSEPFEGPFESWVSIMRHTPALWFDS